MTLDETLVPEEQPLARVVRAAAFELIRSPPSTTARWPCHMGRPSPSPVAHAGTGAHARAGRVPRRARLRGRPASRGAVVRDRVHLGRLVARLDAGRTRNVFVIGGDGEDPGSSRALSSCGPSGARHRLNPVGIAGYPQAILDRDRRALLSSSRSSPTRTTSPRSSASRRHTARWIDDARRVGLTLPIHRLARPVEVTRMRASRRGSAWPTRLATYGRTRPPRAVIRRVRPPRSLAEASWRQRSRPDANVALHVTRQPGRGSGRLAVPHLAVS